jgi:kinesin family protein 2/24
MNSTSEYCFYLSVKGKTFTMMGSSPGNPSAASKNSGLYVLAARDIFIQLQSQSNKSLKVFCSCFEIYGGKLFDLLNDRSIIKCLEDSKQQVHLSGLSEHEVCSQQELLDLMTKAHNFRSVGSTGANLESSRSHQVLQIVVRAGSAANPIMNDAKARRPGGVVGR